MPVGGWVQFAKAMPTGGCLIENQALDRRYTGRSVSKMSHRFCWHGKFKPIKIAIFWDKPDLFRRANRSYSEKSSCR